MRWPRYVGTTSRATTSTSRYIRGNINAHTKEGEDPALYFERVSIIREKISEVGIPNRSKKPTSTHCNVWRQSMRYAETILQNAPDLILNMIEDWVRTTYRELEPSRKHVIDGSAHFLVAAGVDGSGGRGSSPGPSPGHYTGGAGGAAKGGTSGHWDQQQQQPHQHQQQQCQEPNQEQPP